MILLEKKLPGYTDLRSRVNSETVVEEDKFYANSATHSPDTLSATEKVLGLH